MSNHTEITPAHECIGTFTTKFNIRHLDEGDFEVKEVRQTDRFTEKEFVLCDRFDVNGKLSVVEFSDAEGSTYSLEYCDADGSDLFYTDSDSFANVLESFNAWRTEMYLDLSLLPNASLITAGRTQFITRERIEYIQAKLRDMLNGMNEKSLDFITLEEAIFLIKAIWYISDRKQDRIDQLEKQIGVQK